MELSEEQKRERIDACRELYLMYGGEGHELIERDMRQLGYKDFHRRSLYRRFERGRSTPGWVETYGWKKLLPRTSSGSRVPGSGLAPDRSESLKGTNNIAQGKAIGRNPGSEGHHVPDPVRVEQTAGRMAPLQGADEVDPHAPGVSPRRLHPGLLSSSPSATAEKNSPPYRGGVAAAAADGVVLSSATTKPDDPFREWLKRVSKTMNWDTRHHKYICERLAKVTSGETKRLMIFMPPRHGKSELVTVRYAGWRLKQDPSMNVIIGSYNQRLANRFSRKIKRVLSEDHALSAEAKSEPPASAGGQLPAGSGTTGKAQTSASGPAAHTGGPGSVFPFIKPRNANSEAEWETTEGGGLRAVGVGSGVTGFGASLIIVDDPVKSRAEAESDVYRQRVWEWFNDDLYTRLEPDGAMVLIQTRWHEDDLAGRLLREMKEEGGEQWDVIDLPALAEASASLKGTNIIAQGKAQGRNPGFEGQHDPDPDGVEQTDEHVAPLQGANEPSTYSPGVPPQRLHPGLLSLSPSATETPITSDPLGRAPGEALWPERYDAEKLERLRHKLGSYSFASLYQQHPVPAEGGMFKRAWFKVISAAPPNLKWKRAWDLGVTASDTSDFTASVRVAYDDDEVLYIDSAFRSRIEYPDQRRRILAAIQTEPDTVEHGVEATANGLAVVHDLLREPTVRGRALRAIKVRVPKIARALPLVTLAEQGRLRLVRGAWNEEFIDEACSFPSGTHDDQIDAASLALKMHQTPKSRLFGF